MWRKGTLRYGWWECKLMQPWWKTVWRVLRKLKIELPHDPAIPLLGIYPNKTIIQKDRDFPGVPRVKTSPSNAGGGGPIPG